MTAPILLPGRTCATFVDAPQSGLLVDSGDYFRAVHAACAAAQRTILMCGWQFDANVALLHADDARAAELPSQLIELLRACCARQPELEIYLLAWDASPVFTLERQPLQALRFSMRGCKQIRYHVDNHHPMGASTHQKYIIVDRSIAFLGGMDLCNGRWDERDHRAENPERRSRGKPYLPYHDVQAYVTGDAVDVLRTWFAERWQLATGETLHLPDAPRDEIAIVPTREMAGERVALARTVPGREEPSPPIAPIQELYQLHLRAIASAERLIYIENQYYSSDELTAALIRRMEQRAAPPLEIVMVLPARSGGFKERVSIGVYQHAMLERLTKVAARTGHHLGVYYPAATDARGKEAKVFIHAKVLAVDDRFFLVSSANTSNRSMTLDTELGIAWETDAPSEVLCDARVDLLAEHAGIGFAEARERFAAIPGLVERLDGFAATRAHKLRIHRRNVDEKPGPILAKFLPDGDSPFDPDHSVWEALPEPEALLDRIFRDPFMMMTNAVRHATRRIISRLRGNGRKPSPLRGGA